MTEPAQKMLVGKYLDWDKVSNRLFQYEYIRKHYNLKALQGCSEKSPYYCHYLAWRLGTWENESWFDFLNKLLKRGSLLPNWNEKLKKEDQLTRYEFEKFFHFLWELQVAKFFSEKKVVSVEWIVDGTKSSPDLKVTNNGKTFYVDCYVYTKSFALELFIWELFNRIHTSIKVQHTPCIIFSLPKDKNVDNFLDEIFRPYINPDFMESMLKEAEKEYPVLLPTPQGVGNFYIYVEGDDPDKYIPGKLPNAAGPPKNYFEMCFREAISSKQKQLRDYRPNLLAVNYLLSLDFQMAANRQNQLNELGKSKPIPFPDFGNTIDGVFFSTCGIDDTPSLKNSYLKIKAGIDHPILSLDRKFRLLPIKGDKFLYPSQLTTQF